MCRCLPHGHWVPMRKLSLHDWRKSVVLARAALRDGVLVRISGAGFEFRPGGVARPNVEGGFSSEASGSLCISALPSARLPPSASLTSDVSRWQGGGR